MRYPLRMCALLCVVLTMVLADASANAKVVASWGDVPLAPASVTWQDGKETAREGKLPTPWTVRCWHKSTSAWGGVAPDPAGGDPVLAIRNTGGKPSVMLQMWRPVTVKPGRRLRVFFDWLTQTSGQLKIKVGGQLVETIALAGTGGKWQSREIDLGSGDSTKLGLEFHTGDVGEEATLYLRSVKVEDIGPDETTLAAARASAVERGFDTTNWDAATGYYATLRDELAALGLPKGQFLLGSDETEVFGRFSYYGQEHGNGTSAPLQPGDGLPFQHAVHIDLQQPTKNYWGVVFGQSNKNPPMKKGDVILGVAYFRSGGAADAGATQAALTLKDRKIHARHSVMPPDRWKRYYLSYTLKNDVPADTLKTEFFFGYGAQKVDLGGIAFIYFADLVKAGDLPETSFDYSYDGREPDAAWRQEAESRIERLRKGDLTVRVVDAQGNSIAGADVEIKMQRHAFLWGSTAETTITGNPDDPRRTQFVETFLSNFNHATVGTFKWGPWRGTWRREHGPEYTLRAVDWAIENGLPVHGHTPIWHQFGPMPFKIGRETPDEMRQGITDWLHELLTNPRVNGRLYSWDAINHPYGYSQVWEHVGKDIMLEELRLYRQLDPKPKLFVNEGGIMTLGAGQYANYREYVKWLMENGVPLDGVGFMCHFSAQSVTPPEELLRRLDEFAALDQAFPGYDLELKVTEFDISVDRSDPAQVALQCDYMRDFLTAVFSHPDIQSVVQWGFWAGRAWKPAAMLYDENWNLRPHGQVFRDLVFGKWWTDETGKTGPDGTLRIRGFKGDYAIRATTGERTRTIKSDMDDGKVVTIVLE